MKFTAAIAFVACILLLSGCKGPARLVAASEAPLKKGWTRVQSSDGTITLHLPDTWTYHDPNAALKQMAEQLKSSGQDMPFLAGGDDALQQLNQFKLVATCEDPLKPGAKAELVIMQTDEIGGYTAEEVADELVKRIRKGMGSNSSGAREASVDLPIGKAAVARIKGYVTEFTTGAMVETRITMYVLLDKGTASLFTFETTTDDPVRLHALKKIMETVRIKV